MPFPIISFLSSQHEQAYLTRVRIPDPGGGEWDGLHFWTPPRQVVENRMLPMQTVLLPKRHHLASTQALVRAPQMAHADPLQSSGIPFFTGEPFVKKKKASVEYFRDRQSLLRAHDSLLLSVA